MPDSPQEVPARKPRQSVNWRSLLWYAGFLAAVYFGNIQVQTWLGRQALAEVKLEQLSYQQALQQATAEGKPVLVDISALWCPSCRKLDKQVLAQPQVQQAIEQRAIFTRVELETPEGEKLQQQFQIKGVPTLLVLNSDGSLKQQLPLTFDPAIFINRLKRIVQTTK